MWCHSFWFALLCWSYFLFTNVLSWMKTERICEFNLTSLQEISFFSGGKLFMLTSFEGVFGHQCMYLRQGNTKWPFSRPCLAVGIGYTRVLGWWTVKHTFTPELFVCNLKYCAFGKYLCLLWLLCAHNCCEFCSFSWVASDTLSAYIDPIHITSSYKSWLVPLRSRYPHVLLCSAHFVTSRCALRTMYFHAVWLPKWQTFSRRLLSVI